MGQNHRGLWSRRSDSAVSLAGRISLHPDGHRLAVSFVRQHGKIYMLKDFGRIHILVRPTDAEILAVRNGSGPDGRALGSNPHEREVSNL